MTRRTQGSSRWLQERLLRRGHVVLILGAAAGDPMDALAGVALEMAGKVLKPGGGALIKVCQGAGFQGLSAASRARSPEICLLASGLRLV